MEKTDSARASPLVATPAQFKIIKISIIKFREAYLQTANRNKTTMRRMKFIFDWTIHLHTWKQI